MLDRGLSGIDWDDAHLLIDDDLGIDGDSWRCDESRGDESILEEDPWLDELGMGAAPWLDSDRTAHH